MVNLVQKVTTGIETNNNVSVDLEGKEQRAYERYLWCYNIVLYCLITEIQIENIVFSDYDETFDDTDKDPTFDPYCTIVQPSDDDDQAIVPENDENQVTIPDDDEVSSNADINQNIYSGRPKKGRKRKHTEQSRANVKLL